MSICRVEVAGLIAFALAIAGCGETEKPMPPELICHAGSYLMEDGRVMGVIPRAENEFRYVFINGETGVLTLTDEGGWRRERDDITVGFGDCDDASVSFSKGGNVLAGELIPYSITETRFDGVDGERAGRLVLPADGEVKAIVVSVHGSERWSGRTGERLQVLMPAYGIGVFAYDKRGTGESEGKYTQDFHLLAGDATLAKAEALRLFGKEIDSGYWGGSQGGWVAPLAAYKEGADFVIAAYGMAEGALAEDREEVFQGLRDAGYGEDVIEKAAEITDATGRVMASGFKDGYAELSAVRKKYGKEPWFKEIEGEFTGQFLDAPNIGLRIIGPFLDVGTSWDYEPRPVIESLTMPQLWILASGDRAAPNKNTIDIIRDIQKTNAELDMVIFPNTAHGMVTYTEDADGNRTYGSVADGYYALIRDFILTREPTLTVEGPTLYLSEAAAEEE